jgi:hypothetical protein
MAALSAAFVLGACIPEEVEIKPPVRPTAQQETANVIALVRGSQHPPDGVGAKLKSAAETVFARSFGAPITDRGTTAGGPMAECFANGCLFNVVYADRCAQLRADMVFSSRRSPIISQWPGTVTRTPPIKGDGNTVSVTWALFITPDRYPELDKILQGGGPPPPPPPVAACTTNTPSPVLQRSEETK